jgi:hypothetical protein
MTLSMPPLDLIFPEYFQSDPLVEKVALENLTDEELLFKWNSHNNPDVGLC